MNRTGPWSIEALLASYPRARPALPDAQASIYAAEYKRNRQGADAASSLAQRAEAWMHRRVARGGGVAGPVLELGAGTLNQVPHESPFLRDWGYDVVEPQADLYADSPHRHVVRDAFADVSEVPGERRYARIISVAVLEHLAGLPGVLRACGALLEDGGVMQHGIPSEGGLLWGLGWRATTGLSYKLRTGHSYGRLMRHEHLSDSEEIVAVVKHFFEDVTVERWPTPLRHGSLYTYVEARGFRG